MQNTANSSSSEGEEEEQAQAMDIGSSPQPAASVMGQQWADQLPQVLTFLQQLGLQVSLLHLFACCCSASLLALLLFLLCSQHMFMKGHACLPSMSQGAGVNPAGVCCERNDLLVVRLAQQT